jgi:Domain of Unknown Function (DUF1080)
VKEKVFTAGVMLSLAGCGGILCGQISKGAPPEVVRLDSVQNLELIDGKAEIRTYRGRRAVHFLPLPNHPVDYFTLAIIADTDFKDGTLEIEVAGAPSKEADADNRGFVGLAFHVQDRGSRSELFYLRPTNGRAKDQLRRNHSVQYESAPDFSWKRLRTETPGLYESYADLQPGVWTKMKVVVSGTEARLYVNGAAQPSLVVNDLKLGATHGQIALWAYGGTEAYFSNLKVY